ncbi:MAG: hypothetical protein Q3991_01575 [Rothia sp. (in: high G+C Gram-positive bacteria)]|uniref:hypothetical protein n=1 Tax=Rothia sp. (in: high G+C Gram-positive bacteria) TaxID=1885016 RepID=UPI0026DCCD17|nr:hypothetical protein [Rothia sp. (in: high G+C Gram-positive bacteria)]MDO4883616.1 hypothetical protein [Rothia sp. (in: high G+C Gram-positive bacteria)]
MKKYKYIFKAIENVKTVSDEGFNYQNIRDGEQSGDTIRLAQGQYMSASEWAKLNPNDRHLARIIAHARTLRDPIFSHRSAAIIHGIETLSVPDRLQVLGSGGASNIDLQYRQDEPSHRATIMAVPGGIRVIDPLTAVIGSVRETDFAEGMVIAESALQSLPEITYDELHASLMAVRRCRGAKNAHRVAAAMSTLSASPAETLARVALLNLGLKPTQQHLIPTPLKAFRVGAALIEHGVVVEVTNTQQRASIQDALAEESRAEAIRGEGWEFVQLTWADVRYNPATVRHKLHRLGVL